MDKIPIRDESVVLARLQAFSLSSRETNGVELGKEDVFVGMDEAEKSLIGKFLGRKKKLCGNEECDNEDLAP